MTAAHTERETLTVDVNIPAHADRVTTPLFRETRAQLIKREMGRCWVCGQTAEEVGHPLEAHHHPIERCLAEMIDWAWFENDARKGLWGTHIAAFDWDSFDPKRWETFVDDMRVNGRLLCKAHHTGKDEGIHAMPFPLWIAQKYGKEGYRFNKAEVIHHEG